MTAYEAIKKEGREEGREKERINLIVEGYKRNIAIDLLAQITNSSVQQVKVILKEQGFKL